MISPPRDILCPPPPGPGPFEVQDFVTNLLIKILKNALLAADAEKGQIWVTGRGPGARWVLYTPEASHGDVTATSSMWFPDPALVYGAVFLQMNFLGLSSAQLRKAGLERLEEFGIQVWPASSAGNPITAVNYITYSNSGVSAVMQFPVTPGPAGSAVGLRLEQVGNDLTFLLGDGGAAAATWTQVGQFPGVGNPAAPLPHTIEFGHEVDGQGVTVITGGGKAEGAVHEVTQPFRDKLDAAAKAEQDALDALAMMPPGTGTATSMLQAAEQRIDEAVAALDALTPDQLTQAGLKPAAVKGAKKDLQKAKERDAQARGAITLGQVEAAKGLIKKAMESKVNAGARIAQQKAGPLKKAMKALLAE